MTYRRFAFPALAAVFLTVACAEDANAPRGAGPAVSFVIVSGGGQTGKVGEELPLPVQVLATDAASQPVPNVVVNFVATSGGGSVFAGAALTDVNGIAADIWRLGTVAGSAQVLEVRAVDAAGTKHTYGTFTATAVAGDPVSITALAGDGQSAVVNTAVPLAPTVALVDSFGNPVPNYPVTFAVTTGGGVVNGGSATSDAFGVAGPSSWILGPVAGANSLSATATGVSGSPVTFDATGIPAVVLHLGFTTSPSTAQNGVSLAPPPAVQLLDPQGVPVPQSGIPITVALNGSGAALSGPQVVNTDGTGTAAFSNLVLTGTVGDFSLTFQGPGLSPLTSSTITLTAGAPFAVALDAGDGQSANVGTAVPVAPSVLVTDQSGNPVPGASVSFGVTSGGGSLSGSPALTNASGIAQVGSWILGPNAGANGLAATAAALPGSPVNFSATGIVPAGNFWTTLNAPMKTPRRYTAYGVINDVLWVVGGRSTGGVTLLNEGYSLAGNSWLWKRGLPGKRTYAMGAVLNGELYVVGGRDDYNVYLSSMYSYNAATNNWTLRAPIPEAKDFAASAVVDGILYVAGGGSPSGLSSTVYAYDPATNTWSQKASMPMARGDLVGASLGGLFYVVGGTGGGAGADGLLLAYDPSTDSWSTKAQMPAARTHMHAEVVGGKLYAIGGFLASTRTYTDAVDIYDPISNSWSAGAPISVARDGGATGVIGGKIYLSGGETSSGNTGVTEVYTP